MNLLSLCFNFLSFLLYLVFFFLSFFCFYVYFLCLLYSLFFSIRSLSLLLLFLSFTHTHTPSVSHTHALSLSLSPHLPLPLHRPSLSPPSPSSLCLFHCFLNLQTNIAFVILFHTCLLLHIMIGHDVIKNTDLQHINQIQNFHLQ